MRKKSTSNDGRAPEIVFNGDPGERVEAAITAIEDLLGVQGLGQLLVPELSPLEEKFAEPQDPGPRPRPPAQGNTGAGGMARRPEPRSATPRSSEEPSRIDVPDRSLVQGDIANLEARSNDASVSTSARKRARKKLRKATAHLAELDGEDAEEQAPPTESTTPRSIRFENEGDEYDGHDEVIAFSVVLAEWECDVRAYDMAKKVKESIMTRRRAWQTHQIKAFALVRAVIGVGPKQVIEPARATNDVVSAIELLRTTYNKTSKVGTVQRLISFINISWDPRQSDQGNIDSFNLAVSRIIETPERGGVGPKVKTKETLRQRYFCAT
jgi:hypothetical protein